MLSLKYPQKQYKEITSEELIQNVSQLTNRLQYILGRDDAFLKWLEVVRRFKLCLTFVSTYLIVIFYMLPATTTLLFLLKFCKKVPLQDLTYYHPRSTPIGNNFSVPDSCCFDRHQGCGQGIFRNSPDQVTIFSRLASQSKLELRNIIFNYKTKI